MSTTSLVLYFVPNTRAHRARWLLEEMGVPYELVRLDPSKGDNKTPEYLAIHPHGHVPALVDDGVAMFESAAIVAYLADKYPDKGLQPPAGSKDRAHYFQWIVYSMSELEPTVAAVFYHTVSRPEAQRIPAVAEEGRRKFGEAAKVLTAALAGKEYLVGGKFSAADVMIGGVLGWAKMMNLLGDDYPELLAYVKRLTSRPAFKAARA